MVHIERPHGAVGGSGGRPMITIACPWCEGDAPMELEVLQAVGGRFTCPACQTSVELVEEAAEALALAA
jgi:hypothetical protein